MSEIRFYHLQTQSVEQALPGLLAKAVTTGKRILVRGTDEARIKKLNDVLWSYNANSFLPHGIKKDGFSQHQPIYLTADNDDNPNGAEVLITIDGAALDDSDQFPLQCTMFDGNNTERLTQARAQWKSLTETDTNLTYWQQTSNGWEKKG